MKTPKLLKIPIKGETNLRERKFKKQKVSKFAKKKLKVQENVHVSFSIVKVRVLWCDWLICEITRTAREYKKNAKGGEEEKNCHFKFKDERDFLQFEAAASPLSNNPTDLNELDDIYRI